MPNVTVVDDVEDAFRAALESDAGLPPADIPAPPRKSVIVDPDAPHGRDEAGDPVAPFGLNKKTGRPNLRKPGKPPKEDQARVQATTAATGRGGTEQVVKRDYSAEISDLTDGVWMLLSSAPIPVPRLRTRVHAQAAILNGNKPGIVKGINLMAQNNDTIGKGVEKLTSGGASWVLPAMFALGPFVAQTAMMWRGPIDGQAEQLAAANDEAWDATVRAMTAGLAEAEDEAMAA